MSEGKAECYKHELYTYVENEKDADAVAWAWVNKEKVVKFPFKFPPLGPNEIRANYIICRSLPFRYFSCKRFMA